MKKIKIFEEVSRSELFWTSLLLISLIIVGIVSLELLAVVLLFGSFFVMAFALDDDDNVPVLWMFLMPITWAILIMMGIILGITWIYEKSIVKFNNWLNKNEHK